MEQFQVGICMCDFCVIRASGKASQVFPGEQATIYLSMGCVSFWCCQVTRIKLESKSMDLWIATTAVKWSFCSLVRFWGMNRVTISHMPIGLVLLLKAFKGVKQGNFAWHEAGLQAQNCFAPSKIGQKCLALSKIAPKIFSWKFFFDCLGWADLLSAKQQS